MRFEGNTGKTTRGSFILVRESGLLICSCRAARVFETRPGTSPAFFVRDAAPPPGPECGRKHWPRKRPKGSTIRVRVGPVRCFLVLLRPAPMNFRGFLWPTDNANATPPYLSRPLFRKVSSNKTYPELSKKAPAPDGTIAAPNPQESALALF